MSDNKPIDDNNEVNDVSDDAEIKEQTDIPTETETETPASSAAKWYVVHTYSGHEDKVRANLERSIQNLAVQDKFTRVVIPTEEVIEVKKNKCCFEGGGVKVNVCCVCWCY